MWLRDALPHHIAENDGGSPITRVMVYGYESSLLQSNSFQNLDDIGKSFLDSLLVLANTTTSRPIVIVAHSLGGLVVKQSFIYLSKARSDDHQRFLRAVYGIVFFGVPHLGMDISSLKPMVGDGPNRALLESIGTNAQVLSQQYEDFRAALEHQGEVEVVCFYETLESQTAIQDLNGKWEMDGPRAVLVSPQSATHCRPWEDGPEYRCPINRTHSEMVKFGHHDEEYDKVIERIKGLARRAISSARGPLRPHLSQRELDCLKSLAFAQMDTRASDIEPAVTGTGEWLLRHMAYTSWATSNHGLLCIKGNPGSGKSTLLKYALDHQEAAIRAGSSDLVLSFFFHGRGDELQKTPLGFFRHILYQLLSQVPAALSELVDEFQRRCEQRDKPGEQHQWQWHPEELWHFFRSSLPKVLETYPIWLFVDALDECGEKNARQLVEKFRLLLESLVSQSLSLKRCHILFACRHYPLLDGNCELQIRPEHENKEDISAYVQTRLAASNALKTSTIANLITERANGVFMWARLVVDQALNLDTSGIGIRKISATINSIPEELGSLYEELTRQMDERATSLKVIQLICFAERPLSLDELRWALIVDTKCKYKSLQECQSDDEYDCNLEKRLKTLSRGLAELTPSSKSQFVQFIHESVKDFFISGGLLLLENSSNTIQMAIGMAHIRLSGICIQYLAMEEIDQSTTHSSTDFPFLDYATMFWVTHAKKGDASVNPQEDLMDLFPWPSNTLMEVWVRVYIKKGRYSQNCPASGTRLVHVLSRYGIIRLLTAILKIAGRITDIDAKDGYGRTPLSWAAKEGHDAVVRLLLDRGAEIDMKDTNSRTLLSWAAEVGHDAVVELLRASND
ncbi:hypothetical protein GQ53DRAFT_712018 [Thozetella sp. PMI_491]|nr:hypothetical protein GQ53DRAFT_712018 [Thozetella sp. PMI_491]